MAKLRLQHKHSYRQVARFHCTHRDFHSSILSHLCCLCKVHKLYVHPSLGQSVRWEPDYKPLVASYVEHLRRTELETLYRPALIYTNLVWSPGRRGLYIVWCKAKSTCSTTLSSMARCMSCTGRSSLKSKRTCPGNWASKAWWNRLLRVQCQTIAGNRC